MEWWEALEVDWRLRPSFFDYFALALTLGGLLLAWLQFRKARTALQAERDTKSSLEYNQLLALLPEFHPILSDIDSAVHRGNTYAAQRELVRFARICGDAATLAGKMNPPRDSFITELTSCAVAASEAKEQLALDATADLIDTVRVGYRSMTEISNQAAQYATELRFDTPLPTRRKRVIRA
ncbi:hypothetical protein [Planctomonas deserti]|uniref:hypothetical protein n=1 Tax=Planctomonas deserti TaxID=2144185 RepID=UPI00131EE81B|nr:hypothetical protein [Planctomonas deserti]